MFKKIFWINIGLFIIVALLSYNLYKVWSQIMVQMKAPSVQIKVPERSEKTGKEAGKEEEAKKEPAQEYKPSSRMSYAPVVEKDLFRPEREEWQPPPPPEEEETDLKQTSPYPQYPGQFPQPEIKQPTVHGVIIIGENRKYAIMQGWTREEPQERTRKINVGGQIKEVPLPTIPGKVVQDGAKAYKIGDTISEAQIVDILPNKVVMEKEDGERYDVLLREPAKLETWKHADGQASGQVPGTEIPGMEGQVPGMPGFPGYPIPPQGMMVPYPQYIPPYPVPPPGFVPVPPPGFMPPQAGGIPSPPLTQPPNITRPQQIQPGFPPSPGFPPGRFSYPPGPSIPGITKR